VRNFQLTFSASHVDPAAIVEASHVFQSRVLCNNPEYKGLVMNLALPLAAKHEPLMHAWISSTLLFMSGNGDSPQMREESVLHYNHAVRELQTSVLEGDLSAEWKRATVMLCHAIELLQPIPSPLLARSHLMAAHHMFQATIGQPGVPQDDHDGLLFEAYIIRTATNCLFQQDIHKQLPFNYVENLSAMHSNALKRRSLEMSPLNCPWLSNFGPDMMDMIFKTSWIYARGLSGEPGRPEAIEVWHKLEKITAAGGAMLPYATRDSDYKITRRIWSTACRALLWPLVPAEHSRHASPDHEAIMSFGLRDMGAMSQAWADDMTMFWPLVILAALSRSFNNQSIASEMVMRFRTPVSAHTVDHVRTFLTEAWDTTDKTAPFNDSETLRSILL
jgi:hypothetical protein